jgi:hypothetical protein
VRASPNIALIASRGVRFDFTLLASRLEQSVNGGVMRLNEKQLALIETLQDMISGTLDTYEKDPHHAPAKWILENWWCTLEAVKRA